MMQDKKLMRLQRNFRVRSTLIIRKLYLIGTVEKLYYSAHLATHEPVRRQID